MKITRTSRLTGVTRTQEINVSQAQLDAWKAGTLIQDAMPHLTADEREFIMSGITKQEWIDKFGPGLCEELEAAASFLDRAYGEKAVADAFSVLTEIREAYEG